MKKEYSNLRCKDSIGERNLYCYDCELDDCCPFQKEGRNKIDSECKRWESLKKLYKDLWKKSRGYRAGHNWVNVLLGIPVLFC